MPYKHLLVTALAVVVPFLSFSQSQKPKLFIDCRTGCDESYFRQEMDYVDHVRDIRLADIHILVTGFGSGSGGETFTFQFNGRKEYEGTNLELEYATVPNTTRDEERAGMLKTMNTGMITYLLDSDLMKDIDITVGLREKKDGEQNSTFDPFSPMEDPWRLWVFEASVDGNIELEAIRRQLEFRGRFEANHITEDWKIRQNFYYNRTKTTFEQEEEDDIVADLYSYGNWGQVVRSISDHWSVGISNEIETSVFNNIALGTRLGPAIEYSVFPYNEVNYRELVIAYSIRHFYREYNEETVFRKLSESLVDQSLRIALRLRRPWGSVFSSLEGRHFFHDFRRNSVEFDNRISWRGFQGFAVDLRTNIELINDQLSLPRGEASLEELLLEQKQRSTNYQAFVGVGFSYTFGSIYNNIVNTRL